MLVTDDCGDTEEVDAACPLDTGGGASAVTASLPTNDSGTLLNRW
jgi:hypothetical protein